ncbi:MAG: hypothetical protein RIC56_19260 [Pseudomonadales bacterium]
MCLLLATSAAAGPDSLAGEPGSEQGSESERRQYTFSWMFSDDGAMRPRGGNTRGPAVTLAEAPSDAYLRLMDPGISKLERDRRAILAMAGAYRTSFDFIETVGFTDGYEPRPPYQSWGTEYVYVVADEPEFISLQHVLVMVIEHDDGSHSEPIVVKHWRQDWRYEDTDLHAYAGHRRWQRKRSDAAAVAGAWSQAVFQVDDSPRYEALGRWEHRSNHSTWTSDHTWRPLPRREFSVRDDYHLLAGTNRVTITPQGWIHEEDNLKVVLDDDRGIVDDTPYLAREAGLNRYEHIVGYDFSAGDAYWRRTGPFWAGVRAAWDGLLTAEDTVTLKKAVDGRPLFSVMFELAERFAGDDFDTAAARDEIDATLADFVE